MAVRLSGIPVAREMRGRIQAGVEQLHQIGQIPTMGIVRVGARPEDISYETGATKLAQSLGIAVSRTLLPGDVGERQLLEVLREVNENQRIHGCLLFRPLPAHLNTRAVLGALSSGKDIDAMTGASMGGAGGVRLQHFIGINPRMTAAQTARRLVRDENFRIISFHSIYTPNDIALLYPEHAARTRAKCDIYIFRPVVYNIVISLF